MLRGWRCPGCRKSLHESKKGRHLAICQSWICSRCQKRQTEPKDEHLKKCIRWKCRRCNKVQRVLKEEHWEMCKLKPPKSRVRFICSRCGISSRNSERHKEHQARCRYWKCPGCRRQKIPLQQKDAHRKAYTFGTCGKCGKQNIPLEQREVHRKECGYMVCGRCSTNKILLAQYDEHAAKCALKYWCCPRCHRYHLSDYRFKHLANCNVQKCPMCQKALKGQEVGSHLEQCQNRICPQCNASVFARQYDKHLQTCTVVYCRICRKSNILLDEIKEHNERCSHRSRGLNTSIPVCDKQVTRTLLAPDTCFPISEAIKRARKAWTEEPLNTIVADFEMGQESL